MLFRSKFRAQVAGPSSGPIIGFLVFLARSRELRRSFGASGTGVVSIASCEALDARVCELLACFSDLAWRGVVVRPDDPGVAGISGLADGDFAWCDEVLDATESDGDVLSLASTVPELVVAAGVVRFRVGGAAFAAPTMGAGGVCLGTLCVVRATAIGRCGAAPRRTTSAKDVLAGNDETRCRASRNVMFSFTFIVSISFSFFQAGQALEYAG